MKRGFTLEVKVGLFVTAILLLMAWISLKLGNYSLFEQAGYTVSAVFDTAAGLDPESKVLLAGLRVGQIRSIRVEEGRARVDMRIRPDIRLPKDSRIQIMSQGLLGQKYLDIAPGDPASGYMEDGDRFTRVGQPVELGRIAQDIQPVVENLAAITGSLAEVMDSEAFRRHLAGIAGNVDEASGDLARILAENQERLAGIMANLESLTGTLAGTARRNQGELDRTLAALPEVAEGLAKVAQRLGEIVEKNQGNISDALSQLADVTGRLSETLESVQSIARKVDEGEGTVGGLVNDRQTLDELTEAVAGLNDFLARARRTKLEVAYNAEYLFNADLTKHHMGLYLWPRPNQYYMIGVTADQLGTTTSTKTTKETVTNPGEGDEARVKEVEEKTVQQEGYRFDAQIARRFWDLTVRGGLIEGKGGAGVDYYLWEDRIKFSVEAFDFGGDTAAHLRSGAQVRFLNNFVVTGGVDDFIDSSHEPYWYVGAGLAISDDDIKSVISILPASRAF